MLKRTLLATDEATTAACRCDEEEEDLLVEHGSGKESGGEDVAEPVVVSLHLIIDSPDLQVRRLYLLASFFFTVVFLAS